MEKDQSLRNEKKNRVVKLPENHYRTNISTTDHNSHAIITFEEELQISEHHKYNTQNRYRWPNSHKTQNRKN